QIAGTLIDALPEPAALLGRDGTVLLFNSKAGDLFGGLKLGSHISGATRNPQVLDAVKDCSRGKPLQTVMFSDRVPVERHMSATVSWFGSGAAQAPCILLFIRDLTEQRRLDQLRSEFMANASHEIKTPLASLLGFIETLQGAARHDEAARDRFLGIMAKQGGRMARLIDNLMSLSRVEMRAHVRPQDMRRQQSGAVPMIEIAIEDDGPGIPGQHSPRLTERFYRVPGLAAPEKGGTGLGLAIVKHVVNRHRGELRIFSEEGAGSKFTVLLAEHTALAKAEPGFSE
ncbi:MAG: histidine kinase, partial [Rhodomicrobium sp.]|nr:histidine kinase [Rhodomicrobium sp.]